MRILTLINVSGFVSCFWVRVHEIRVDEIKAYKIYHLLLSFKKKKTHSYEVFCNIFHESCLYHLCLALK